MRGELSRLATLGWTAPPASADGVRYVSTGGDEGVSYPSEGLDALGLGGGTGYWFDHRAASAARLLARMRVGTMWEVGSGTGAMASRLVPPLTEVVTVEPLARGAQSAARLGLPALCGTLQDLQLPEASLECVGAFDVVEHILAAGDFLDEVRRVLRPGGVCVVTVPAFELLWGDEDDAAGHVRRYTRRSLTAQFAASGFAAVRIEYLYAGLVAPAAALRALPYRLGRRRTRADVLSGLSAQLHVPAVIDRAARAVLTAESAFAERLPLPFGLSLLAAFRTA